MSTNKIVFFSSFNEFFIDQVFFSATMAGYWVHSFSACLRTSNRSRSINTQRRTCPISSHIDLTATLAQYENLISKRLLSGDVEIAVFCEN